MSMPKVAYKGNVRLGTILSDCYVLDNGERVLSYRNAVKAISDKDSGDLGSYNLLISKENQVAENVLISHDKILISKENQVAETLNFLIEQNNTVAKGISTDYFISICEEYVKRLYEGRLKTERQREIAYRCSFVLSGFSRLGLKALVDESTGYQEHREKDELQVKLDAYLLGYFREWEKAVPDEYYIELGRLTSWKTPLGNRPKYWGKLMIELVYDTLEPQVVEYLKNNKPPANTRWHQRFTENVGLREFTLRCYQISALAKMCHNIVDLKRMTAEHYGRKPAQTNIIYPVS